MGKISITYREYGILIDELTVNLKQSEIAFDGVYGIPRGGLPIASHLSNHLDIPLFTNIKQFTQNFPEGNVLITKDVMNEGLIFDRAIELIEIQRVNFTTAVIFYRSHSKYKPDFFVKRTESWIVFPWEPIDKQPDEMETVVEVEVEEEEYNDDIAFMVENDLNKDSLINII